MSHKGRQRSMSLKKRHRPKDRATEKLRPDVNELAFKTVQAALGETEKPIPPEDQEDTKTGADRADADG